MIDRERILKRDENGNPIEEMWESEFLHQLIRSRYQDETIIEQSIIQTDKQTSEVKLLLCKYERNNCAILLLSDEVEELVECGFT